MSVKVCVYRMYDGDDVLLYVGASTSPINRLASHGAASHWVDDVCKIDIEWFPTRKLALANEAKAISTEHPLHNIAHATRVQSGYRSWIKINIRKDHMKLYERACRSKGTTMRKVAKDAWEAMTC